MTLRINPGFGKALYGFLFLVAVPLLLYVWAKTTTGSVPLPVIGSIASGWILISCGIPVMIAGMAALIIHGKGLPMNAYPPVRYVTQGVYKLIPHPIYTGFSLTCIGAAIAANSPSGLWLVCPTAILGCVAIVEGFEKHDLRRRFPTALAKPLLHIPPDETSRPTIAARLSVYILVLLPWLILYQAIRLIGIPPDAMAAYLPFEQNLPVVEWTEIFYISAYPFVVLVPLVVKNNRGLREFAVAGLIATALMVLLFLTIPLIAPPRPFTPTSLLGRLLEWERAHDTPAAAFPSFHVIWALLAAMAYAKAIPSLKILWWSLGILISLSCITTGMHAVVDIMGGIATFFLVTRIRAVWGHLRLFAERIANSWKEWRFGPIRFIYHGIYAGAGAFAGLCIVGLLLGSGYISAMMIVGISAIAGAALWAQIVEGSPSLLRPYGWYGGLLGTIIGALISGFLGADPWLLLAAFSVGIPWIQFAGRMRCLVQGCCHGHEAPANIGIRYTHPRSRVCRLSDLAGAPVHPTPLYSMLWNVVVAIIMARLWFLHAPASLIIGIYLITTGLGRFIEEAYRGEPQTTIHAGLRLYQWLAACSIIAGIFITMIGGTPSAPDPSMNWESIIAAGCFAIFTALAFGMDFPNSDKRFARLV